MTKAEHCFIKNYNGLIRSTVIFSLPHLLTKLKKSSFNRGIILDITERKKMFAQTSHIKFLLS